MLVAFSDSSSCNLLLGSAGHVHAYERTNPVYDYTVNKCGSVHITIGDGGNSEGLSFLAANKIDHSTSAPCYSDRTYMFRA